MCKAQTVVLTEFQSDRPIRRPEHPRFSGKDGGLVCFSPKEQGKTCLWQKWHSPVTLVNQSSGEPGRVDTSKSLEKPFFFAQHPIMLRCLVCPVMGGNGILVKHPPPVGGREVHETSKRRSVSERGLNGLWANEETWTKQTTFTSVTTHGFKKNFEGGGRLREGWRRT